MSDPPGATGGPSTTGPTPAQTRTVLPVFVKNTLLPAYADKEFSTAEICEAREKVTGFGSIVGAQRISGLWRIYPANDSARNKLLINGITLRGIKVTLRDRNPFLVTTMGQTGAAFESPTTKVIINNIPISFSDDELLKSIKELKCEVRSKLIQERDRDSSGKLTRWLTGRRFLYITVPPTPLPKTINVGPFRASLYHWEQKQIDRSKHAECKNCFSKDHATTECREAIKCKQCFQSGHKAGDPVCPLTPVTSANLPNVDLNMAPPPPPPPRTLQSSAPVSVSDLSMPPPPPPLPPGYTPLRDTEITSPSQSPVRGRPKSRKTPQKEKARSPSQQTIMFKRDGSSTKRGRSPSGSRSQSSEKHARTAMDGNNAVSDPRPNHSASGPAEQLTAAGDDSTVT